MPELAEYDFGEAIRRDPDNADFYINRAEVRIDLGKKKEALSDLNHAVALGVQRADLATLFTQCR